MNDEQGLVRALELAERGRGTTAPNPVVGAVLVRDGEVVGEGWHEHAGGPHAEIAALGAAGERARGATLYVTLEPCAHHGRTPSCAEALVEAGVRRVLAAVADPNPLTNGAGFERLRAAGIEVELAGGELEWRARVQNEAFRVWIAEGRPFVVYKAAVTLDGRVTVPGSRWVTGEASRRRVHELRAQVDAVAVGMGTVRADDPQLTARDVGAERQPRRLAFGQGPLPGGFRAGAAPGPTRGGARRTSPRKASSPCFWRAARPSPPPSSAPGSSTSCCSSSPRGSQVRARGISASSPER